MDDERVRIVLEAKRTQLTAELADLTRPPEGGSNLSFGKRIGEGTTEAVERIASTAAARAISAALADVERAIEKLDEGSYGLCDGCGQLIGRERHEAVPSATLCVGCAGRRSR